MPRIATSETAWLASCGCWAKRAIATAIVAAPASETSPTSVF
jgi:hypothetical protein